VKFTNDKDLYSLIFTFFPLFLPAPITKMPLTLQ